MKKHLARRLLSLALALIMVLGILPTNLGLRTGAVTPEQEATARSLIAAIDALEGEMYSKYVRVTTLKATNTTQLTTANNTLKGLSGNYIVVANTPIATGGDTYYALNMGRSHAYYKYGMDVVQVIGDQLYGYDPLAALNITYDKTGSETTVTENKTGYTQSVFPTGSYSARARYFITASNGKYLNISNDNEKVTLQQTKISTNFFVDYNVGTIRIIVSGNYYHDRDKVSNRGIGFYPDGAVPYATYMGGECQKFHLYKERTDRINVYPLYEALMEARTYLENPQNPYEDDRFRSFLITVQSALDVYDKYNKDSYSTTAAIVNANQTAADKQAQMLADATAFMKPYDQQINELQIPATQQVTDKNAIGNGNTYFMLGRDDNGFYRAIDINTPATGDYKYYAVFAVDVVNGKVLADNLYGSFWISTTPGQGIGLLAYKSGYLNTKSLGSGTNANLTAGNLHYFGIKEEVIGDYPGAFYVYRGASNDVTYINCNGYSYRAMKTSTPSHRDYNMFFFQVSPLTLKLFKALEYVEPFAGGNADGRYDETVYAAFAETLSRALELYRANRNTMTDDSLQPTLDALAEELESYAGKLTDADSKASYIDVPVEILDFAADRLLFEFYSGSGGNKFSLQDHTTVLSSVANDTILKPLVDTYLAATSRIPDEMNTINVSVRQNLLLNELQDGHPVYAEHTVGYVAAAILTEWMADSASSYQTTYESQVKSYNDGFADTQWQDAFWNRLVQLYSAYKSGNATKKQEVLGTYAATVQKAGSDGMLLWSEVQNGTAFDLAYYILSGVWKPVTDVLPDGRTYNTVVTERDTMRMYYDASVDRYVIASANELVYDDHAFYNTSPAIDRVEKKIFNLSPINGLGFEKNGVKTDPSNYYGTQAGWQPAYAKTNVSFTLHASGMFIYYEDQEQMFDFVGDDDVYFYINDKLVVDIGGTHSAAYFSMDLKEANEKYSLGMEDGGIYSFDMFYADRHTHGSNMKFSTNIKILSPKTLTSKGQYAVEVAGSSTVGSNGKGGEMIDNQLVNVGDVVAYSFDITNHRDCPVTDLEFHDESLGVHLNSDNILTYPTALSTGKEVASLTNPTLCNGVVTQFKDLIIEYTTLNSDGTLATGPVTEISPTDMINLIRSKVKLTGIAYTYAPLEAGIYRVPVATAQQLGNLLKEGIPMECRISIYGFLRKTVGTDIDYRNELTTYCSYRRSANKDAELATITGKASRILRVPAATEMPDIPRIEITLDYGKPVQIPLADITNQIFFEKDSPASVVEIVGYVEEGYNGQLLKKLPKDLLELAVGDTVQGLQGTFTLRETSMEYAMWEFMEKVETLYAVVKLNNFNHAASGTQYEYALVELRLIPANMMYYEAEDFTASEISYEQVGGSYPNWKTETDHVDTEDNQDFNPVNHRTYDMVIDRDNIPAEAFFADFEGTGYVNRYRLQPQYHDNAGNAIDFDQQNAWVQHANRITTVDTVEGILEIAMTDKISAGKEYYHYTQTVTGREGSAGNTKPIQLVPGEGHIFQMRLRVENCVPSEGNDTRIILMFSDNTRDNVIEYNSAGAKATDYLNIPMDPEEVFSGDYFTVTASLDPATYYTQAELIDAFRFQIEGMKDNGGGKIQIDYVYLGPEKGMDQDVYDEYLYFTFDNTEADQLRYTGSIYGSTSTTARNYDTLSYWSSSTAGGPVSKGGTLNITNGCLVFADKDDGHYNYVHAGKENVAKETPFSYRLTGSDVYRIRFKITETPGQTLAVDPGSKGTGVPIAILEVGDSGLPGAYCHIDLEEYADGEFHTLTMSINAPNMTSNGNNITMLNWIRPTFSYISGATFTIDYIYVGPASMVDKVTQKADYLFFDFTNNDAAKSRYSNPAYGTYGKNFDTEGWHVNHSYSTPCLPTFSASTGTMSFKTLAEFYADNKTTIPLATAGSCNFSKDHPLDFELTGNEYFKVRMKIEGTTDTSANFIVRYADGSTSNNASTASSFSCKIPATAIQNGEWFTLEGYITFGSATKITALRFDVDNISMSASNKPITVTYDYFYVGPAEKASVTTESLFFGFDNEEEDRARYGSYVYGGWNYDDAYTYGTKGIGHWVTSSEINVSYHDYAINNEKGTLNVGVGAGHTGKEEDDWIYGPYIMTTDCYGYYSMSADRATLKYRPEHADVVQVRFRVSNCEQGPGREPNVVFLFGGYDTAGNYVDYNDLVVMRKFYTLQEGYVTVSIPTNQAFRELAMVTNLGLRFQNVVNYDGEGLVEIDYIYVGPGEGAPYTYGYDSSYDTNSLYSDGNSLFTEGNGVRIDANPNPAKYTETRFSFKGTGFDLISRTGADQATIRVEIYTDPARTKESRIVGTAVNLKGELELYQIPVYSKHDLTYGTYYVSVMVNAGVNYPAIPALSRGDDFYLDAIRIYDPIDVSRGSGAAAGSDSAIAYAAYLADIEAHPVVKEVRDILLTAEEYTGGGLIQDGAVFVDYSTVEKVISPTTSEGTGGEDVTDPDLVGKVEKHITSDIVTYKKIGPNNETYLGPQQLVAFKILVFANKIPNRLDIGAKSIVGSTAKMEVKAWGWDSDDEKTRERLIEQAYDTLILGPSHQYYSLYLESDIWETVKVDGKWCRMATVIIANPTEKESVAGENVLSITDVRVGHRQTVTVQDPGIDGVEPEPTEATTPTETNPGSDGGASDVGVKSIPTRNTEVELPEDEFIRFVVTGDLMEEVEIALKDLHGVCDGEHIPGDWQTVCLPGVERDGIEQIRCTRCGEVLEEKRTPGIAAMTFAGASVSLQSDLAIHYKVNESYFTELGYTNPYVVVTDNGVETVIRDYTVSGGKLSFVYKNIAPHRIGDTVTATLYAYYNGTLYSSESRDYSIADYCYNILNKYGTNEKYATLRTLLVDILHYGAKTQEFAGYRTDSLCNARLTEAQLSWGTELTREPVNLRDQNYEVIENPTVQWKGAGLNLKESVAVRFCMVAESYEDLEVRITLNGITESYTAEDFEYRADGTYIHFTKLNAAQMSEPILVAAYRNGEQVSNTMCYSIESYAYAKQNDTTYPYLGELVERMICYGDSARAYIGK